ncbi:MAG: Crp/Fnr family transcriptional regulator [Anaerolineales bacterium]|nr:Crp/Fnr family transcriptional regulator [Chloroflexota bacterium]MBL6983145.1 Crp/Fnr family transcriptional regulator [Anaerolineales bacterium]
MAAKIYPHDLVEIPLFQNLNQTSLSRLSEQLHQHTYQANTNIITAEQPGEVVYIVRSGTVKIFMLQEDGTMVILAILGAGDVVGEMSLIDSAGRSANVLTLEKSTLLWMDRDSFWGCLEEFPEINYNLVRILSRRVRLANEQIQALASLDVYGRLARQFLAFAEKYGEPDSDGEILIPIHLTQSELADLVGASRRRVNQVMGNFKRQKYISVNASGYITVKDRSHLARLCR